MGALGSLSPICFASSCGSQLWGLAAWKWSNTLYNILIWEPRAPLLSASPPPPLPQLRPIYASVVRIFSRMLNNTMGQKTDTWSVDVRLYFLLFRKHCFNESCQQWRWRCCSKWRQALKAFGWRWRCWRATQGTWNCVCMWPLWIACPLWCVVGWSIRYVLWEAIHLNSK